MSDFTDNLKELAQELASLQADLKASGTRLEFLEGHMATRLRDTLNTPH